MFSELILVLIYIFPGAFVEVFDRMLFGDSYKESSESNFEKAAKFFGYSVVISTITLFVYGYIFGKGIYNLDTVIATLNGTFNIVCFCGMSLVATFLFVCVRQGIYLLLEKASNKLKGSYDRSWISSKRSSWIELIENDVIKSIETRMIVRVTLNGQKAVAGFAYSIPYEYEDGIILTRTDSVEAQLQKEKENPEDSLIGERIAVYFNTKTGDLVEFFDGSDFLKKA